MNGIAEMQSRSPAFLEILRDLLRDEVHSSGNGKCLASKRLFDFVATHDAPLQSNFVSIVKD